MAAYFGGKCPFLFGFVGFLVRPIYDDEERVAKEIWHDAEGDVVNWNEYEY